jgi:hypothetical protein
MRWILVRALSLTFIHGVLILLFVFVLYSRDVHAGWLFGPDNFEECITKYQKQAASDLAARAFHMACDKKFIQKVDKRYADCILEHVGNTRSDLGVRVIVGACSNLYITNEDIEYSMCILKNMPGIEVDIAARSIAESCGRKGRN